MRLSLRGKKLIVNQTLLSRLWCIGKILTIQKYIKKEIEKRIFDFLWNRKKKTSSQTPSSALHLEEWTRHRDTIKLSENIMDSKVIKSHQCSQERSHAVSIDLNSDL